MASSSEAGEIVVHRVQGSVAAVTRIEHPASLAEEDAGSPPALGVLQWAPFHPNLLAAAATDGTVGVWAVRPAASPPPPHAIFEEHTLACTGLAWSPVNQHLLATCSSDASLLFYDVTKCTLVRTIQLEVPLTSLAFASNGVHCAVGSGGGELLVFDLRVDGDVPWWSVHAHHGAIRALSFQRSVTSATTVATPPINTSPSLQTKSPPRAAQHATPQETLHSLASGTPPAAATCASAIANTTARVADKAATKDAASALSVADAAGSSTSGRRQTASASAGVSTLTSPDIPAVTPSVRAVVIEPAYVALTVLYTMGT